MTDPFAYTICRPVSLILSVMIGPILHPFVSNQEPGSMTTSPLEIYSNSLPQLLAEVGVAPRDIGSNLSNALAFPPWTADAFILVGLIILVLGVMAWFSSPGYNRQVWGRRLVMAGFALAIVGFGFQAFLDVLRYVLSG